MINHTSNFSPPNSKSRNNYLSAFCEATTSYSKHSLQQCKCTSDIHSFTKIEQHNQEIDQSLQFVSDIKNNNLPYKEIEVGINNSRLVLRIQKYSTASKQEQEKWDPPCECIGDSALEKSEIIDDIDEDETKGDIVPVLLFEAVESTVTNEAKNDSIKVTNKHVNKRQTHGNFIEKKNMFILKIRRQSETSDKKKENIDIEFRAPKNLT